MIFTSPWTQVKTYLVTEFGNCRKEKSGAHIAKEKEEPEKKPKDEDPKDLYYW